MIALGPPVGALLKEWRQRRRMSQLELALEANISARHISFLETGRSLPSRDTLLHLSERLAVPLRERNRLLTAAGFAPLFPERTLDAPELEAARKAVDLILKGHEPFPALAIDRHWTLLAANATVNRLLVGVSPELLRPPVNVLRLSLHPQGLAPRIVNLAEWRSHLLERLHHQIDASGDPVLRELRRELEEYPAPTERKAHTSNIAVPFQLSAGDTVLSFYSTTTIFGTPVDITLSELAIESFFPADAETSEALRELA